VYDDATFLAKKAIFQGKAVARCHRVAGGGKAEEVCGGGGGGVAEGGGRVGAVKEAAFGLAVI
jgi:hypothetical protein